MSWSDVFGEPWFWALAGTVWLRAALGIGGAPRRLVAAALRAGPGEVGPALFLRDMLLWRLGPGRRTPLGLAPLRWPALGAAVAYGGLSGLQGETLALALTAALAPIAAASLALEPKLYAALAPVSAWAERPVDAAALAAFADRIEQLWRLRLASAALAVLATVAAAAATRP